MIAKVASLTKGAGGPSHLDTDQFCHMLLKKKFKTEPKELRVQTLVLARTLASTIVDPKSIKVLTSCRILPLNKNPSVRTTDVCESLRRIMGKAINWILKDDIQERVCSNVANSDWSESWSRGCNLFSVTRF